MFRTQTDITNSAPFFQTSFPPTLLKHLIDKKFFVWVPGQILNELKIMNFYKFFENDKSYYSKSLLA